MVSREKPALCFMYNFYRKLNLHPGVGIYKFFASNFEGNTIVCIPFQKLP